MSRPEHAASPRERTPDELAELRAERARFSRERPGPEELMASGEHEGPYRQGNIMALLTGIAELKRRREQRGLSLADVSEQSGLDRGMLSRLENGKILNPTIATLWRYADAIGGASVPGCGTATTRNSFLNRRLDVDVIGQRRGEVLGRNQSLPDVIARSTVQEPMNANPLKTGGADAYSHVLPLPDATGSASVAGARPGLQNR